MNTELEKERRWGILGALKASGRRERWLHLSEPTAQSLLAPDSLRKGLTQPCARTQDPLHDHLAPVLVTSLHGTEARWGLNGEASVTCSIVRLNLSHPETHFIWLGRTHFKSHLVIPPRQLLRAR